MNDRKPAHSEKLSHILRNLPDSERRELARTWEIAGDVEFETVDRSAIGPAYARVEAGMGVSVRLLRRFAAIAALLAVGVATGFLLARLDASAGLVDGQAQFMILVRHQEESAPSADDRDEIVAEFAAWSKRLAEQGHLIDGRELGETGSEIRLVDGSPRVSELNLTPASSSGYFLIRAGDIEEATRLAKTCPYLERGGTLEVRRIIQ